MTLHAVRSEDCLAISPTKHSAKADELIKAVLTSNLLNVDAQPPSRTMLQNKAFLVEWLARNLGLSVAFSWRMPPRSSATKVVPPTDFCH